MGKTSEWENLREASDFDVDKADTVEDSPTDLMSHLANWG